MVKCQGPLPTHLSNSKSQEGRCWYGNPGEKLWASLAGCWSLVVPLIHGDTAPPYPTLWCGQACSAHPCPSAGWCEGRLPTNVAQPSGQWEWDGGGPPQRPPAGRLPGRAEPASPVPLFPGVVLWSVFHSPCPAPCAPLRGGPPGAGQAHFWPSPSRRCSDLSPTYHPKNSIPTVGSAFLPLSRPRLKQAVVGHEGRPLIPPYMPLLALICRT